MLFKFLKITVILTTFVFTTGFFPLLALFGPGLTVASSGSLYKASAQYLINTHIQNTTGKTSFAYVKEEVTNKNKKDLDKGLKNLLEKRIKIVHIKLAKQNKEIKLNKKFRPKLNKRIKIVQKR